MFYIFCFLFKLQDTGLFSLQNYTEHRLFNCHSVLSDELNNQCIYLIKSSKKSNGSQGQDMARLLDLSLLCTYKYHKVNTNVFWYQCVFYPVIAKQLSFNKIK